MSGGQVIAMRQRTSTPTSARIQMRKSSETLCEKNARLTGSPGQVEQRHFTTVKRIGDTIGNLASMCLLRASMQDDINHRSTSSDEDRRAMPAFSYVWWIPRYLFCSARILSNSGWSSGGIAKTKFTVSLYAPTTLSKFTPPWRSWLFRTCLRSLSLL